MKLSSIFNNSLVKDYKERASKKSEGEKFVEPKPVVLDESNSVIVGSDKYDFVILSGIVNALHSLSKNRVINNLFYKIEEGYNCVTIIYDNSNGYRMCKDFLFEDFKKCLSEETGNRIANTQVYSELTKYLKSLLEVK